MKKTFTLVLTLLLHQLALYGQVGIGTSYPRGALDINDSEGINTLPLVLPTNEAASNMENPLGEEIAPGSMMYDSKEACIRFYQHNVHKWSECITGGPDKNSATVTVDCTKTGFEGSYIQNEAMTDSNKFTLELTNNSFTSATISLKPEDLTLKATDPETGLDITETGLTVTSVSPTTVTLNSGETKQITYKLSGKPAKNFTLKGTWTKLALKCSNTVETTKGMAKLDLSSTNKVVVSLISKEYPNLNIQGIIDNNTNKITIDIPYSEGKGVYSAYTSNPVKIKGEGGETNTLTLSFPEGKFSSTGTIKATVNVGGNGTFNVKKQEIGVSELIADLPIKINKVEKGNINLSAIGGVPDRNFGDGIHDFIYLPVVGEDGRTWLNNNLGADYSNMHHQKFNPGQKAKSGDDYNGFGSIFQWGRLADSHEIIQYENKKQTPLRGTTSTQSKTDIPESNEFISTVILHTDWRSPSNQNLWQGVNGINNPCPVGYRVPTKDEFKNYFTVANIKDPSTVNTNKLGLTHPYLRYNDGKFSQSDGGYWTSSIPTPTYTDRASNISVQSGGVLTQPYGRSIAFSVRCIKD